jgi:hypothetical protein
MSIIGFKPKRRVKEILVCQYRKHTSRSFFVYKLHGNETPLSGEIHGLFMLEEIIAKLEEPVITS